SIFFFSGSRAPQRLPSFPTRRSSDLDLAAVELDDLAGDREAEAGASLAARRLRAPLLVGREQLRQVVLRDPLAGVGDRDDDRRVDRKSTRLNSSHVAISYAVFCLKKK